MNSLLVVVAQSLCTPPTVGYHLFPLDGITFDLPPRVIPYFTMQSSNRSLERGIAILRAFKPGSDLLGNGEISERTGLSCATVSRLTQTLVLCGMLDHSKSQRAYRLAAPVLSLAHAMRSGSPVLQGVAPLMRKFAEKLKVNVGLAVADGDEMVYLESVRYNRKVSLRNVLAGQRVPVELTSLGRAWLAAATDVERTALMVKFKKRRTDGWILLRKEIEEAIRSVEDEGFCAASWQPEVVALSTPIVVLQHPVYVINMSVNTTESIRSVVQQLKRPLLELAALAEKEIRIAI